MLMKIRQSLECLCEGSGKNVKHNDDLLVLRALQQWGPEGGGRAKAIGSLK